MFRHGSWKFLVVKELTGMKMYFNSTNRDGVILWPLYSVVKLTWLSWSIVGLLVLYMGYGYPAIDKVMALCYIS